MAYKNIEEQRAKIRQHYKDNKQYYLDKNNKKRQECKNYITSYKESNPCMDCGTFYPACVMDFDHRNPPEKVSNVSLMVNKGSLIQIKNEMAKCDLVCSNCHRIRTHLNSP